MPIDILLLAIIPLIVAFIPIINEYLKENRGNKVYVNLTAVTPQFSLSKNIKKDLTVLFKGKPIENIISHVLKVRNGGPEIIEPFELTYSFFPEEEGQQIEFVEIQIIDPTLKTTSKEFVFASGKHGFFKVWRGFLHPYRKFKEEILELIILSNTTLIFENIGGGDRNWLIDKFSRSPRNIELYLRASRYDKFFIPYGIICLLLVLLGGYLIGENIAIVGIVGMIIFTIHTVYRTILITKDTNKIIYDYKTRIRRLEQTYGEDLEVRRELEEFERKAKLIIENE